MHTLENVDHSKGNPRPARRTRSVKAKPVAGLERTAKTPIAFIGTGKHSDSATGPKNIRCRGRSLGTCFDEILPDSKRGHKEFVLLGPPLSGRHRQTRMQTRLSARSSGFVESVGSSGGSDFRVDPMCGRYRRTTSEEELARRYHIPIPSQRDLPISWNIAPTQDVLAIRFNPESKQRTLDTLRWGLIPNWAKDPKVAYKTINARAETIDTAPSYRQAFKKRPCLVPTDGFFEWKKVPGGKIPHSISMKDDSPFVFAGLWED
jgi:hypothetical protein